MRQAYELIHAVYDAHRGLPVELAKITGKGDTWHRSHGYEPRTENPLANGNKSAVHDYLTYVRQFEAADRGAGQLLNTLVHNLLAQEFAEKDLGSITQGEIHVEIEEETCDVRKWLAGKDLTTASRNELLGFEKECDEAVQAIMDAKSRARVIRLRSEMSNGAGK
jgi:hypothetical protein